MNVTVDDVAVGDDRSGVFAVRGEPECDARPAGCVVDLAAGLAHREWSVGLLTVLAAVLLSIVVNMVMFLFTLNLGGS